MARLLKTPGSSEPRARMLFADFDCLVRDGATFQLNGSWTELHDGDMVMFSYPNGVGPGINVEEDERGLCAHITVEPLMSFRIGLEKVADAKYAFRPDKHHTKILPALAEGGAGVQISWS